MLKKYFTTNNTNFHEYLLVHIRVIRGKKLILKNSLEIIIYPEDAGFGK